MRSIGRNGLALGLALAGLIEGGTSAAVQFVTNTNDSGIGSLRQALINANQTGGNIIFSNTSGTITLLSELPALATNMAVLGSGPANNIISGNSLYRVFNITAGVTSVLSGLTIRDGRFTSDGDGAGVRNAGHLTITNCELTQNGNYGGFGDPALYGGGVSSSGSLILSHVKVTYNASDFGGGIYSEGTLTINDSSISNNYPMHSGAGIECFGRSVLSNVTLIGNQAGPSAPGGGISAAGHLTIMRSLITRNYADGQSGGIDFDGDRLEILNTTITRNSAVRDGGGIGVFGATNVLVLTSTISDNQIYSSGKGGGLFVNARITLSNTTISGNTVFDDASAIFSRSNLTMVNCTVSGNHDEHFFGFTNFDGRSILSEGTAFLAHSTIASNEGGILNSGTLHAYNSLIANNLIGSTPSDFSGVLTSDGFVFLGNRTNAIIVGQTNGNVYNVDPHLGPLQNNGGPTRTHALLPGSPALDHGNSSGTALDQRGVSRPRDLAGVPNAGDGTDIGAYESAPPKIMPPVPVSAEFQDETGAIATYAATVIDICADVNTVLAPPSGSKFPIGASQVQVTATDGCGNSSQLEFSVTVLGARGVVSNVVAELAALRAGATNRNERDKLDAAIAGLTDALATSHWLDEKHIVRANGLEVFAEWESAVSEILSLIDRRKKGIGEPTVLNLANRVVRSSRLVAVASIQDAQSSGGNLRKIEQDLKQVAKGDHAAARGKLTQAIEYYRSAWQDQAELHLTFAGRQQMQIQFLGAPAEQFVIQASTNLSDWLSIATVLADSEGNVSFTDSDTAKYPARFYRVILP